MSLAPDSITIADAASGLEHAGKNVSSKFHPIVMAADPDGHIQGTASAYIFCQMPRVTTAAATDFFELFNATGSGKVIRLRGLWPIIESTAAFTQSTTWRFDLFRTSAVGTGGTAATESATAPAAGVGRIYRLSTVDSPVLPAQVTITTLPTAGATAAAWMFPIFIQPEETNPASNLLTGINFFPQLPYNPAFELQEAQGFKVRQITATASTGSNIGWLLGFTVIP
jgi:hypothetical protein